MFSATALVADLLELALSICRQGGNTVARRTVLVCDNCGKEVGENKGAAMRVTFTDARRGSKVADLCDTCAGSYPGRAAARRGRRPKSATV
jgi:hypothetical protein